MMNEAERNKDLVSSGFSSVFPWPVQLGKQLIKREILNWFKHHLWIILGTVVCHHFTDMHSFNTGHVWYLFNQCNEFIFDGEKMGLILSVVKLCEKC